MGERWLIATDLDGTLFDHTLTIAPRVRHALATAQNAGHALTLATGRMYRATLPIAEALAVREPLICYQGALVRRGDAIIHHLTLPLAITQDIVRYGLEHGIHLNAYVNDRLFVAERTAEAEYYTSLSPTVQIESV
ncbi:MAG: HAD-IIB family hydrolase, partial [Ardenticatenales bacterium]|nr:HAD-IIB family hydrolase [Ardenticatenales bacterium]